MSLDTCSLQSPFIVLSSVDPVESESGKFQIPVGAMRTLGGSSPRSLPPLDILDLCTRRWHSTSQPRSSFRTRLSGRPPARPAAAIVGYFGSTPSTPITRAVAYLPSTFSSQGRMFLTQFSPEAALLGYMVIRNRLAGSPLPAR